MKNKNLDLKDKIKKAITEAFESETANDFFYFTFDGGMVVGEEFCDILAIKIMKAIEQHKK